MGVARSHGRTVGLLCEISRAFKCIVERKRFGDHWKLRGICRTQVGPTNASEAWDLQQTWTLASLFESWWEMALVEVALRVTVLDYKKDGASCPRRITAFQNLLHQQGSDLMIQFAYTDCQKRKTRFKATNPAIDNTVIVLGYDSMYKMRNRSASMHV